MRTVTRLLVVSMNGLRRERGQADGDVLRAFVLRRAVADPLAGRGDDRLTRAHVEDAALVLDAHHAAQHDRDLLELRTLARLFPPRRRSHSRDADVGVPRAHASGVLFDP